MPNESTTQPPAVPDADQQPPAQPPEKKSVLLRGLRNLGVALTTTGTPTQPANEAPAATTEAPAAPPANAEPPPAEAAPATPADATPPADGVAPAAEPAAQPDPTPAAPAPDTTPRIRKVKPAPAAPAAGITELVAALKEAIQPAAPAVPATAQPSIEDGMPEPDKNELEFARYAAQADPRYKDYPQRYLDFVKARNEFVGKQVAEHGAFDPKSEEFQDFMRSRYPAMPPRDRETIIMRKAKDDALAEARAEFEKERIAIDRRIRASELTPTIQHTVATVERGILAIDDPVVKAFAEDPKKAAEVHKLEAPIVVTTITEARAMTNEFIRISEGLVDADPAKNKTHMMLDTFISNQGRFLDAMPAEQRATADGKILVSPEALLEIKKAKRPDADRYRTFTPQEVIAMIEEGGRKRIADALTSHRKQLESAGYVRKQAEAPKPAAQPSAPAAPPAAKPPVVQAPKAAAAPSAPAPSAPPPVKTTSRGARALGYNK